MAINTSVSVGEFLDKISILEIKKERIDDDEKLVNIERELNLLISLWDQSLFSQQDISKEYGQLKAINEQLWEIEDKIREKEMCDEFDKEFVALARSVYITNDKRAHIKKQINVKLGSELVEEKSYKGEKQA